MTPTTLPPRSTNGPPEFPGWTSACVLQMLTTTRVADRGPLGARVRGRLAEGHQGEPRHVEDGDITSRVEEDDPRTQAAPAGIQHRRPLRARHDVGIRQHHAGTDRKTTAEDDATAAEAPDLQ